MVCRMPQCNGQRWLAFRPLRTHNSGERLEQQHYEAAHGCGVRYRRLSVHGKRDAPKESLGRSETGLPASWS